MSALTRLIGQRMLRLECDLAERQEQLRQAAELKACAETEIARIEAEQAELRAALDKVNP